MNDYFSTINTPWQTYGSASTLYITKTVSGGASNAGTLTMPVKVAPPPKPLTEVERLFADVDAVCELARVA